MILIASLAIAIGTETPLLSQPPSPEALTSFDESQPVALDDAIRSVVDGIVDGIHSRRERAQRIHDYILDEQGVGFDYDEDRTLTARAVFRERTSNCVGYANLFVAMARHAGLDVGFVEVDGDPLGRPTAPGRVVLRRGHICAGVRTRHGTLLFDFTSRRPREYPRWHFISDREAAAAHLNNLGAEALFPGGRIAPQARPFGVAAFERARELIPGYVPATINLAAVFVLDHDYEKARRLYRSIEADRRTMASIESNIGTTYLKQSLPEEAIAHFEAALVLREDDPHLWERLGLAHSLASHPVRAARAFERSLEIASSPFPRTFLLLGHAYRDSRRRDKALEAYLSALTLDPDNQEARYQARRLLGTTALPTRPGRSDLSLLVHSGEEIDSHAD